jgi:hypothetical protein
MQQRNGIFEKKPAKTKNKTQQYTSHAWRGMRSDHHHLSEQRVLTLKEVAAAAHAVQRSLLVVR